MSKNINHYIQANYRLQLGDCGDFNRMDSLFGRMEKDTKNTPRKMSAVAKILFQPNKANPIIVAKREATTGCK